MGKASKNPEIDMDEILFGNCEYVKDGLLPLSELLGHGQWYIRMRGITDDIIAYAPYDTPFGKMPSVSAEVNGELLQALVRLAYATNDPSYIDQAIRIGDFYFQEVIPRSNGLPHLWDLDARRPASDKFVLADHGNEILGGLSELVMYTKETKNPAYERFREPFTRLVHQLLDVGLNADGLFYTSIALDTYEPVDARHAHCWGYLFNGVYTAYLITGEARFRDATLHALTKVVEKPTTYLDDPEGSGRNYGSDAYSDALESAIVFRNRFPEIVDEGVLDTCVKRFLARQREDGIIEDWYGDGNYVRTALMYALMKSQGTWAEPWRDDLRLGAVPDGDGVLIAVGADRPWEGRIRFDVPRHRYVFNMPVNYPRLNEWPEWFTVELDQLYAVTMDGNEFIRSGGELAQGLPVTMAGRAVIAVHNAKTQ